jgi:hypothetical protein
MVESRNTLPFIKVEITSNHTAWNLVRIIFYTQRKTHVKLPTLTWLEKWEELTWSIISWLLLYVL